MCFFNNLRGSTCERPLLARRTALGPFQEPTVLIALSVGGTALLCLVVARLYVLYGHPPWAVYGIRVWLRLSVGIWLDANKFWP